MWFFKLPIGASQNQLISNQNYFFLPTVVQCFCQLFLIVSSYKSFWLDWAIFLWPNMKVALVFNLISMAQKAVNHHTSVTLKPWFNPHCLLNMLFILFSSIHPNYKKNVCSLLLVYQALCRALWAIRTVTFLCICTCIILLYLYYFICILFLFLHLFRSQPHPLLFGCQIFTQTSRPYSLQSSLTLQREVIPHLCVYRTCIIPLLFYMF